MMIIKSQRIIGYILFGTINYLILVSFDRCSSVGHPCDTVPIHTKEKVKLINQTDKNITIKSYSRHLPVNYESIDNTNEFVVHNSDTTINSYQKLGPKYINDKIGRYSIITVNAEDSAVFLQEKLSYTFSPQTCYDRPECTIYYDIGIKYHVYAEFDALYAFPQLDSVVIEFEDSKHLSFVMNGSRFDKAIQPSGIKPNILNIYDYKSVPTIAEIVEVDGIDCFVTQEVFVYYITEDHYKEAR